MTKRSRNNASTSVSSTPKDVDGTSDTLEISSFCEKIKLDLSTLIENSISNLESKLLNIIKEQRQRLDEQDERILELENKLNLSDQYCRRNNLEIGGIPKSFEDNDLEEIIINIYNNLSDDIKISSSDIEACHWLDKRKSKVIVRFINRKFCYSMLKNRKNIKDLDLSFLSKSIDESENSGDNKKANPVKIYISENLCPTFKFLWFRCRDLYSNYIIHSYWSWNGIVQYKIKEDSVPIKIFSMDDLLDAFPNFQF